MNFIIILIIYVIIIIATAHFFYFIGYNEASRQWLSALRMNRNKLVAQLLESIDKIVDEEDQKWHV